MDCRSIEFSFEKSEERIKKYEQVFRSMVLSRILLFALYLLGAKRTVVASLVKIPEESVKTTLRVLLRDGFPALLDRRSSDIGAVPIIKVPRNISVRLEGEWCVVDLGENDKQLRILAAHKVHMRTILLSLLNAGLLSTEEIAFVLGISSAHCRELAGKLAQCDVGSSLLDKRQGQRSDYLIGPVQKAEIIQQFVARVATGSPATSEVITAVVNEQAGGVVSDRTVRWHMNKLGLASIKKTLPKLMETIKKNCDAP